MIETDEEFDLLILKDYSDEINAYYKLNAIKGESYVESRTCYVDINEAETHYFIDAWEQLMSKFKIPSAHHNYILYITQSFYSKLEVDNQNIYDLTNAANAIDFFIGYMNEAEIAKSKGKHNTIEEAIDKKVQLQIKSPHSGLPITLNYYGATRFAIDHLYKAIKANDVILLGLLKKHKAIPSLDVLTTFKESLQFKIDNPHHFYLLEIISLLQRYFNRYLATELSRKQHLFLFELLYLFDFLKYSGKVNNHYGSDFSLKSNLPDKKFTSTKRVKDIDKVAFVKALIKNSNRTTRYHKTK